LRGKINTPTSVDVVFANGGLTASGGHPLGLVRRNIGFGIFSEEDAEGGMYYLIDSRADLEQKWPGILAKKPDFIKTFLLYSEEFEARRDDTTYFAWKGLDPELLSEIVILAHKEGLRVSTHVETAADFHNAVVAGVDEINHLPGFRADSTQPMSRYEISPDDAREAESRSITVVTTIAGDGTHRAEKVNRLHKRNLTVLKENGVQIAIGSDEYRQTAVQEALYLSSLGVFDNTELLRMWCENSAISIFPDRKVGFLREGHEASFLVLNCNPLLDFHCTYYSEELIWIVRGYP
jgi:hypothetical protein